MDPVRDTVIDWLHQHYPNLLCDDEFTGGLIRSVCTLVCAAQDAQQEHDERVMEQVVKLTMRQSLRLKYPRIREPRMN